MQQNREQESREKEKEKKVSFIAEKEILSDLSTQFCTEKEETPHEGFVTRLWVQWQQTIIKLVS